MTDRLKQQLKFLAEVDKMKSILRQTILIDKSREENDAEHSWHFALMALTLFEHCKLANVNIDRVIRMALVHDLVEIYAGDTFAYDTAGYSSKTQRESDSADKLFALLPREQAAEYRALWEEFDKMGSADARYASAVDRFQPFLNNSLTDGHTWVKHNVDAEKVYDRMRPLQTAIPELWEFVEAVITESIAKGYLKK